ncbi:MAG TPA: CHASE2 domain-containing protein [Bacteroidota bacterium]|nr:CHASE2 domain-containing protein [Bacteroidota bacterium]
MTSLNFRKKILPWLIRIGVGLGIGLFVIVITHGWLVEIGFLKNIDLLTTDLRYQSRYQHQSNDRDLEKSGDVVLVGISDDDLKAFVDPFPFPRNYYAHIIENLHTAGARAIVFDMTFSAPGKTSAGDSILRSTLEKYNNVILATEIETGALHEKAIVRSTEPMYNNIFYDVDKNIGVVNIHKDRDDVCRSYFPLLDVRGWQTPTLAFAALNRAFHLPAGTIADVDDEHSFRWNNRVIPRFDETSFLLNFYGPDHTFRYVPFSQVIDDSTFQTKDELELGEQINAFDSTLMKLFKNKIVIVGSVMAEERDYHNIPLYREEGGKRSYSMNGMEIHATAIQNVIDGNFISTLDPSMEIILVVVLALACFLGLLALKQLHVRHAWLLEIGVFFFMVFLVLGIFETSVLLFSSSNLLINIVNPSLAIIVAYIGTAVYQYLLERQQKALIKNVFSHYINSSVVNELVANPEKAKLGGDRRELTVMFSDIESFTSISEQFHHRPEGLVELLNEYLDEMTNIVLKYDGTLDKYEGDAVMAFWGAPIPQADHAYRACLAAIEMQKRLTALRAKWAKENKPQLGIRIGLNTGIMIVGNMGGHERFDYTVIGDSVNLASRLEGANKQYGSHIMISEFTYNKVKDKLLVRELDLIQVKGKNVPVKVFEVLGTSTLERSETQRQSLDLYHEGLKLYRDRKWDEAIAYMQQALQLDPECYPAQIYTERANLYQLTPPPADWNGVFIMSTK